MTRLAAKSRFRSWNAEGFAEYVVFGAQLMSFTFETVRVKTQDLLPAGCYSCSLADRHAYYARRLLSKI